jgi:hypothetical protein
VAPYAELLAKPLVGSVAVVDLADIAKSGLPPLPAGKAPRSLSHLSVMCIINSALSRLHLNVISNSLLYVLYQALSVTPYA